MTSRLHEGMTRTQSPSRSSSPLRAAALISLCAATLLILGWAMFSPLGGNGEHQAQAQEPQGSPGGEESSVGVQEEEFEEAYAAYDYKNPFDLNRVAQPKTENTMESANDDNGDANDNQQSQPSDDEIEDMNGAPPAGNKGELPAPDNGEDSGNEGPGTQQRSIQENTAAQPEDTPPANGGTTLPGTEDVNCEGLRGMQKLICKDEQGGSQPGGSGEIEDDRDGGSGRSGAGEPADTFRNGGPAPGK